MGRGAYVRHDLHAAVFYEFERLKSPALLIMGQRDNTATGKERAPKEVAARLVWIQEATHLPQVDSFPKYVRAPLEFIAGRSGSGLSPPRQI